MSRILGIESSCDETAVSIVQNGDTIMSNVIASQIDLHAPHGGIVPELASRQHVINIGPTVLKALADADIKLHDLDAISVTNGPGLAGSLMVGVNFAKALAASTNIPLIGINHLEGHIYAAWLDKIDPAKDIGFPLVCLIASGGHTDLLLMEDHGEYKLLGKTRDDAAGEAFDKAARVLGLGFPGGPAIQKVAPSTPSQETFPQPHFKNGNPLDFSFSGLKTSILNRAKTLGIYPPGSTPPSESVIAELAGGFQEAIVASLVSRVSQAVQIFNAKGVILGGGVAANSLLRERTKASIDMPVVVPPPILCTDNGAMIAACAHHKIEHSTTFPQHLSIDIYPTSRLGL
jgi:N6-L-threonylcarbamoyladenine synthase